MDTNRNSVLSIDEKCHFMYICPICFGTQKAKVGLFELADRRPRFFNCADKYCGSFCAELKKLPDGRYKLSADCPYCGERHTRTITAKELWTSEHSSLACPTFGIKLFLFGKDIKRLEHELEETISEAEDMSAGLEDAIFDFGSDPMTAEMLMIFDRLCMSHSVTCVCGSTDVCFDRENGEIILICRRCGRRKSFAVTKDNLLRLMNASEVILGS